MSDKKLYSVIWAAVVGMSVLSLNAFAEEENRNYVAGSRTMTDISITLGGSIECKIVADAVTGQVDDASIPFKIDSKCSLNGQDFMTAVGFPRAEEGKFTVTDGQKGITFKNNEEKAINIVWDDTISVNEIGQATDDTNMFVGSYAIIEPEKSTMVTGVIKPVEDGFKPGAYSIPLVSAMYTN